MSKQAMSRQVKVLGKFVEVSENVMRRSGKLYVFFMGAEYCPYCARNGGP